jgi:hypothetical protein
MDTKETNKNAQQTTENAQNQEQAKKTEDTQNQTSETQIKQQTLFDIVKDLEKKVDGTQQKQKSEQTKAEGKSGEQREDVDLSKLIETIQTLQLKIEQLESDYTKTKEIQNRLAVIQKIKDAGLPDEALDLIDYSKSLDEIDKQIQILKKFTAKQPQPVRGSGNVTQSVITDGWKRLAEQLKKNITK